MVKFKGHLKKMRPLINNILLILKGSLRLVKFLFSIVATVVIISTAAFLGIYFFYARDLPDIKTLEDYHPPVISQVFASDGTEIGEFWLECRIFTPFEKIPRRVLQAFVDSEDARFFEHKGVDMRSIARAFVANLKAGGVKQGGSTITQQITRSLLLTRERSLQRKIREAILSTRLERYLNKDQILTLYLNQLYLGNRAYGIAAAARNYFKKSLDELSLGQIALIAGLPTAPTNYSPVVNMEEARKRQLHVLSRMLDAGHITKEDLRKAENETFKIYIAGIDKEWGDKDAAYFTEHVRRIVKERYGDEVLYHKGLKIYTTVSIPIQRAATNTIRKGIESLDRRLGFRGAMGRVSPDEIGARSKELEREILAKQDGSEIEWSWTGKKPAPPSIVFESGRTYTAIVTDFSDKNTFIQIGDASGIIKYEGVRWARKWTPGSIGYEGANYVSDPRSILKVGDVILVRRLDDGSFSLAQEPLIQSALMAMDVHTGEIKAMVGGYDFAKSEFNRVTQALRQPGSSFKPFVYSSALDKGYTEDTIIMDGPVSFHVGRNEVWSPKNYGGNYMGAIPFKNCIVMSRNIPTAKIVYDIGTHYLTAYERKLGISTPIEKYLSMALGSNVVYLHDMVQAYTVFAGGGVFRPAVAITKIEDAKGNILESIETPGETKTSPEIENGEAATPELDMAGLSPKIAKDIKPGDLNIELYEQTGARAIEFDKLNLTALEIRTLYGSSIPKGQVITPQTAYIMVDMLKAVVDHGTGTRAKALGRPVAGKTGTTNDETDVWFIGFTPDISAGVWIGFDELQKIGEKVTGGVYAAPLFAEFMKAATEGTEAKDFEKPEGFPEKEIAKLSGGSYLFGQGPRPSAGSIGTGSGSGDRANRFFDEDLEGL